MASSSKVKKRILINLRLLQQPYTGVQSYIYNLVKNLVKQHSNFEFYLLTISYNKENEFINDLLTYPNVNLVNCKGWKHKFFGNIFDIFLVIFFIKNYDLYFSPVNILPVFKFKSIPYVVGILDLCTFIVPETTTKELKLYYDLYLSISLRRADKIITISKSTKKDLIRIFSINTSLVEVVHLGIDEDFYNIPVVKKEDCEILKEFKLIAQPYFLVMGTAKRKNLENILKAYSLFKKNNATTKLVIVVNNKYMESYIKACADSEGLIVSDYILTGRYLTKAELKYLYNYAIAFVYCPYYEGFGLPILESMQNECPVITSNISSMPEVSGEAALLVNPKSCEEIKDSMQKIYSNEGLRIGLIQKGLLNSKKYKWEDTSKQILKIFESLLK